MLILRFVRTFLYKANIWVIITFQWQYLKCKRSITTINSFTLQAQLKNVWPKLSICRSNLDHSKKCLFCRIISKQTIPFALKGLIIIQPFAFENATHISSKFEWSLYLSFANHVLYLPFIILPLLNGFYKLTTMRQQTVLLGGNFCK